MGDFFAGSIVVLITVLVVIGAVSYAVWRVKQAAREVARTAFGTNTLKEGFAKEEYERQHTPKSLSSATSIYLPQIMRDFPEFDYNDVRARCKNVVVSYFHAIDQKDPKLLVEGSRQLREALELRIATLEDAGQSEHFDELKTHQVEITRYSKIKGSCTVTMQCSFQSKHALLAADGTVLKGSLDSLEQDRATVEYVYVQDADKVEDGYEDALGINCPNCGAPVKTLGQKVCEYCGSGIVEYNIRAWKFNTVL